MCNKARLTLKTLYMPPHIAARRTRKLENEMEKGRRRRKRRRRRRVLSYRQSLRTTVRSILEREASGVSLFLRSKLEMRTRTGKKKPGLQKNKKKRGVSTPMFPKGIYHTHTSRYRYI